MTFVGPAKSIAQSPVLRGLLLLAELLDLISSLLAVLKDERCYVYGSVREETITRKSE